MCILKIFIKCENSAASSSSARYSPELYETGGEESKVEENFSDIKGEDVKIADFPHVYFFMFAAGFGLGALVMHYVLLVKGTNPSEPKKALRRPEL